MLVLQSWRSHGDAVVGQQHFSVSIPTTQLLVQADTLLFATTVCKYKWVLHTRCGANKGFSSPETMIKATPESQAWFQAWSYVCSICLAWVLDMDLGSGFEV